MIYNIVMIMVNIHEAKAKLSEYVDAATRGERIVICRHNQPVAELRPVDQARTGPRDLTPTYPGETLTPPAFFEPLSEDDIAVWEGTDRDVPRVAEPRTGYGGKTGRPRKGKARR
jgi:prevent-host-death family protein